MVFHERSVKCVSGHISVCIRLELLAHDKILGGRRFHDGHKELLYFVVVGWLG